jgi:hypothetical protein
MPSHFPIPSVDLQHIYSVNAECKTPNHKIFSSDVMPLSTVFLLLLCSKPCLCFVSWPVPLYQLLHINAILTEHIIFEIIKTSHSLLKMLMITDHADQILRQR